MGVPKAGGRGGTVDQHGAVADHVAITQSTGLEPGGRGRHQQGGAALGQEVALEETVSRADRWRRPAGSAAAGRCGHRPHTKVPPRTPCGILAQTISRKRQAPHLPAAGVLTLAKPGSASGSGRRRRSARPRISTQLLRVRRADSEVAAMGHHVYLRPPRGWPRPRRTSHGVAHGQKRRRHDEQPQRGEPGCQGQVDPETPTRRDDQDGYLQDGCCPGEGPGDEDQVEDGGPGIGQFPCAPRARYW